MAKNLRVGTRVRIVSTFDLSYQGKRGTVTKVHVPGQTSKSGTRGFKYVRLDDPDVTLGFFTNELERVN